MEGMYQDTQDSEKIDHWNFVNAEFTDTNMHYAAYKNNGFTGGEYNFVTPKQPEAEGTNDASQSIILNLRHQLENRNHEITGLKAQINRQELQELHYQKEKSDIINERNELLKILIHKNNMIQRMSSDIKILETQVKSTVSAKIEALIRLDVIEGKEQTLFKETISEFEGELLSQGVDSSYQKLRHEQDPTRNETTDMYPTSVNSVRQIMDDPIHSEIEQQTPNDEQITFQSEILNMMKSPVLKIVKINDSSVLSLSSQGETTKSSENYGSGHLVGSSEFNITVKQKKKKRSSKNMDTNVDEVSSEYNCQNIERDLLSEVRTRGQNQFLRDAFRSIEPTDNETTDAGKRSKVHEKATTPNGKRGRRGAPKVDCKSPGYLP